MILLVSNPAIVIKNDNLAYKDVDIVCDKMIYLIGI